MEKETLSLEEAQEKVEVAILGERDGEGDREINSNMDLGKNSYMFILDEEGTLLAHPNTEETNLWGDKDQNGILYVQEMIEAGNNGGELSYYFWPFSGNENEINVKVTYSKTEPHWNCVVSVSTHI